MDMLAIMAVQPNAVTDGCGPILVARDGTLLLDQFIDEHANALGPITIAWIRARCGAAFEDDLASTILDCVAFHNEPIESHASADFDYDCQLTIPDFVHFHELFVTGCQERLPWVGRHTYGT
jgi:hypothetical protein